MATNDLASATVTVGNFMTDVVEASAQIPTLVDFWAPWCGPCKQLMPMLDRLAVEYRGRFKLAKVNTDEQQELAQQLGIRSLPTVVLFKDRTSVDHFVGVVPEAQIRQMLDRHLPASTDDPMTRIQSLKNAGDYAQARAALEQLLPGDPDNISLQTESAELQALDGDLDTARQMLRTLQTKEPTHPAVKRLAALIAFSDVIAQYPDVRSLREQVANHLADRSPSDSPDHSQSVVQDATQSLELRHALAVHQLLGGDVEPALQTWLDIMRAHRDWKDDLARRSLVLAFELIGDADPIVAQTRRAMTRSLF